jgi:hypothetical protein
VSRFYDPSVQFLLQFEPTVEPEAEEPTPAPTAPPAADGEEPKVVSLDQFRKK